MSHLFIADLHFGHDFVAVLRESNSTEEHDEFIIDEINSSVNDGDILWILGDIGIRTDEETLDKVGRLKGRKMLISGNHDSTHPMHKNAWKSQAKALRVFEYVAPFQRLRLGGEDVMLSHFPYQGDHSDEDRYEQYRLKAEGLPLLCGHVHDAWEQSGVQWNVGIDFGPPVHEAAVIQWAKMLRKMRVWERLNPDNWEDN